MRAAHQRASEAGVSGPSVARVRNQGGLGQDFQRLWGAYTVSAAGSAVGAGVLPFVAIVVLDASAWQVSFLAVLAGLTAAALALPLGGIIERRRKRPVMVAADLVRFAVTVSVPLAMVGGCLTFVQLCCVAVINTTAAIGFAAAGTAHLKALVPAELRTEANGRLESTYWATNSLCAPAGGVLIGLVGPALTLVLDAISFLASSMGIRSIRGSEPPTVPPTAVHPRRTDLTVGWHCIFQHTGLTALFWNAMLFGGAITMVAPLMAVLMLRDLHFEPWQYGLVPGLPCLGGVLGAAMAGALSRRFGERAILLGFGVLRAPWLVLLPLAGDGGSGVALLLIAQTGLLFAAGAFNPAFATYRMNAVADSHMARVSTAWSISSRVAQPMFIAVGAAIAAAASLGAALWIGAMLCAASCALLPWHQAPEPAEQPVPVVAR